jgi:hypothetical protein
VSGEKHLSGHNGRTKQSGTGVVESIGMCCKKQKRLKRLKRLNPLDRGRGCAWVTRSPAV